MENRELILSINNELETVLPEQLSFDELRDLLAAYINDLIKNDFGKLVSYLYRIDVNEQKLKQLLKQFADQDAGKIIASLIIERQQQKIKSRQEFTGRPHDPEAEKW